MADPITPPAGGDNPPAPAPTPPAGGDNPPTPPAGSDPVALAKRLGELETENTKLKTEYEGYRQKADPVLETLWSDSELLKTVTAKHNKRLGITTNDDPPDPNVTPPAPRGNSDERLSQISMIQESFEGKAGINKLPADKQKEIRGQVGAVLKEMLDPKGNKTIPQVFEEVSLVKLPWYLDQAWKLVNRDNDIAAAREAGKTEKQTEYEGQTGIIGSMPAGSVPIDSVVLTPQEKKVAALQGVTEEDYLKYKKKKIQEG